MSRFEFPKATPKLFQAMLKLADALSDNATIPPVLRDLIEIRVSQINNCSHCLRMHAKSFIEHGGDTRQLTMVAVWRNANGFDAAERAALDWAECLTRNADKDTISQSYQNLLAHYDVTRISEISCIVSTMNAWNRLGIAQHELA
ncbi:MAG: carboxymuconolactone decarboxylase family protein [Pseudomonadota bacterium]